MQIDEEQMDSVVDAELDPTEISREATLQWLLDLDRDDPKENLFVVDRDDDFDLGLTDYEAEVASRPMIRGRVGADDLDTYVAEEIVISSDSPGSSIYDDPIEEETAAAADDEVNVVDYSRDNNGYIIGIPDVDVADGEDILGLLDEDDIGEQYLVVKRVKRNGSAVEVGANGAEPTLAAASPEAEPQAEHAGAGHSADQREEVPLATEEVALPSDVSEYISAEQLPEDDEAFDDYLRRGGDLLPGEEDIDGLVAVAVEGQGAIDPDPLEEIDYHQDFTELDDFDGERIAALAPHISELMEEVSGLLSKRLQVMGLPQERVQAEISLGTASHLVDQALEQGYEPLAIVCPEQFDILQVMVGDDANLVYLRLVDTASGETRNRLFCEAMPEQETEPKPAPVLHAVELPEQDIFGEDLLASEPGDDLVAGEWEPASGDIDALLQDFIVEEDGDDICGLPVEEFQSADEGEEPILAADDTAVEELAADEDMAWCIPAGINFSHTSQSGAEIFAEFLDAFIEEGGSELEKLEDAVSAWEAEPASEDAYTAVARILHTIKGIAKGVGLQYYGTLIHNFETLLESLPRPQAGGEQSYFRIVNTWLDAAVRGLDHVQEQRTDIASEFPQRPGSETPVVASAAEQAGAVTEEARVTEQAAADRPAQPETAEPVVEPQPLTTSITAGEARRRQQDKKLADEGARALAAQQSVRITSEKLDLLLNLSNQAQQLGVRTAQSAARNKRASAEMQGRLSSVRAHIADIADRALLNVASRGQQHGRELDALEMDQYTELQEAANILREGVEDIADLIEIASRHNAQAEALLKQQASVISSIGSSIRAARVVPVSRLMPGLRRLVRTVSTDLDKEVSFRVINEVGTLDRDDYARCQTILEHMVRNALDHGIETPEERQAASKPAAGRITIDVRMAGADSVIVLSDDGRGIDPDAMRESAVRKGLEIDAHSLSDREALNLIFHKGFSTAETLSQISGRGVGMDIVLSELQEMGGEIRIESEVGKGTSFHIRIPSNVTVNGALLVTAGESSYAIPLGGLIAVDEVPVDGFFNAVERGVNLQLAGMDCEPAYLGTLCDGSKLPDRNFWGASVPVILAGTDERHMAIAIDDVEEALELVIRSLGTQFAEVPGVAGAATTADGEAVVALDLNLLVSRFSREVSAAVASEQKDSDTVLALVVDDSRTQRMVATSQLESVGIETATAEHGGAAIDLLNSADRLPDIILLDVEMPVKDGIQTLREIRKSTRYSHIPVIMVTSRTGLKHRAMAQEAGCNGYMGKPFNFQMLVGQINELTGHRLDLE